MLPVAILAGGLATRLRPLTDRVPKALLSIAGRPFIFHQLELLRGQGVERVVLCVGHFGEQIEAAVGDGKTFGLTIDYSSDGGELLGTGGALKKALPLLGAEFFVLNGDSYLPCSFSAVQSAYEAARRPALMTVLRNDNRWERSNVVFRGGEVIEYDKSADRPEMSHIDFGLSVLSSSVFFQYRNSTVIDLADICRRLSKSRQLAALEVTERFYEIGSPQGIRDTHAFLSRTRAFLSCQAADA
jgi:N-acetyl-alpha-D-muramate 1-phosphate uridylyltransferase